MRIKDYWEAIKPRTILLLVLAVAATVAAVYLESRTNKGCFDGMLRPPQPQLVLASATRRHTPRLLRVQQQDEGAEVVSNAVPCPKNEDLSRAVSFTPWLAVLLWVGFAASLQVDLDGRRKRRSKRRRRSEYEQARAWNEMTAQPGARQEENRSE